MSEPLQITESVPGKVQDEQLKSIASLLEPCRRVHATARAFSVDVNCYGENSFRFGDVALWLSRVQHQWIAITDTFLRFGDFALYEIPEDFYRNSRALWNWWKIISFRRQYLTLPLKSTTKITRHTSVALKSIPEMHCDNDGPDAFVLKNLNYWEWRWVLDANGYKSRGWIKSDGSWESPMPLLALDRLIFTTAGHAVDLFSFHSSLQTVGEKLSAAINSNLGEQKSAKSNKRQSRVLSTVADREKEKSIDVNALAKLAKLHKSGALTDDEFELAKENLLR